MKRAAVLAALVIALVLLAHPLAGAENLGGDPFSDLTDGGGLMARYPLHAYSLDTHIDSSIVPGSSWGEEAEGLITNVLWTITRLWNALIINLVVAAFSLDLLSADGPLAPIAKAVRSVNDHVLGDPWMVAAISAAGFYAVWKGVIQRRHSEAAGSLALSVVLVIAVMFVVFRPIQTVGQVASWTNDVSVAFLAGTSAGSLANPDKAKQDMADNLFRTVIAEPWAELNFGGLKHCVDGTRRDKDGYPKTVGLKDPRRTACRDHFKVVNGMGGYAPRFLARAPGSDARDREFEALKDGKAPDGGGSPTDCPRGDCSLVDDPDVAQQFAGYHVDKSDSTAVDIQQSGSADNRLGLAAVIFLVSLAFGVLFGALAVLIILVQVGALLIVAFSPLVMLAAVMPGPGHGVAVGWGKKLLTLLTIKAFYALVMAMLIVIHTSLAPGKSGLGWLKAYALIGAFYALVVWKRKWIAEKAISRRDSTKVERTVHERTTQAAGLVAAPFVTIGGMMASRGRQESGLGSQTLDTPATPAQESHEQQQPSGSVEGGREPQTAESALNGPRPGDTSSVPSPRGSGSVKEAAPTEPSAQSRPSAVPPSPEVAAAQQERAVESAPSESRGGVGKPGAVVPRDAVEPTSAQSRPPVSEEFPGLNTPDSVVSPQRRAERGAATFTSGQERAPKGEELAPPPEYRGP